MRSTDVPTARQALQTKASRSHSLRLSFRHSAHFNDINSVKDAVSDKTAAIVIEPVQGEGGHTCRQGFYGRAARAL